MRQQHTRRLLFIYHGSTFLLKTDHVNRKRKFSVYESAKGLEKLVRYIEVPLYGHRVQRIEVRAERLVFLAKDNRHNLLRIVRYSRYLYFYRRSNYCGLLGSLRSTYSLVRKDSLSEEKPLPFGQRVRRPQKNGLRLIAISIWWTIWRTKQDRDIQRMEREESRSIII